MEFFEIMWYDALVNVLQMPIAACTCMISECGVTANIPVLGTGDSGFESRHSDNVFFFRQCFFELFPVHFLVFE